MARQIRSRPASSISEACLTRTDSGSRDPLRGSGSFCALGGDRLGLLGGPRAQLHLEPAAGQQHGHRGSPAAGSDHGGAAHRRQAAEVLPLEFDVGPDARGDGRGERRGGSLGAREGDRPPDPQLAPCAGGSAIPGAPLRCRRRRPAAPGRRSAGRAGPTPRFGVASEPVRIRVPSGKMQTVPPRSSTIRAVFIASSSDSPAANREGAARGRGSTPASASRKAPSWPRSSSACRQGREAPITNGSRKLRWLAATISAALDPRVLAALAWRAGTRSSRPAARSTRASRYIAQLTPCLRV